MSNPWTLGKKIAAGFCVVVALGLCSSAMSIYALRTAVFSKDRIITVNAANEKDAEKILTLMERKSNKVRGYVISAEQIFLDELAEVRRNIDVLLHVLKDRGGDESRRLLDEILRFEALHQKAEDHTLSLRTPETSNLASAEIMHAFDLQLIARKLVFDKLGEYLGAERAALEAAKQASSDTAATAALWVAAMAALSLLGAAAIAYYLTRTLSRQVGTAVQSIQSSSTELQAATGQQATGAKEQSISITEISTTTNELLATSRQIAESARRVAQIAQETLASARKGELTVQNSRESSAAIGRQVELIVGHMLDLGRKSQQVGSILEIIDELAEQTNILSINAAIEAAGAGDAGKRFAIVADEIRKLADRVRASSKEIRILIDDIRASVNTTVMATETCSKTVDTGARHFSDVAGAFNLIASQVVTTTEAAREIELSTKQQSSAVEQVNCAMASVSQAAKETESSSRQTLQTVSQLTTLSDDLTRLIKRAA